MSNKKTESLARVVEVAIEQFSKRDFDDVSISEIAAAARCSTATIYEAFGTKEELYEHVRGRLFDGLPRKAALEPVIGGASLERVLDYCLEVARAMSEPSVAILLRPPASDQDALQPFTHIGPDFATIVADVEKCMQAKLLRTGDAYAFAFHLFACTSYEALLYNVACRQPVTLNIGALLQSTFAPLVTPAGEAELAAYVARLTPSVGDEASIPTLHELMHLTSLSEDRRKAVAEALFELRRHSG